MSTVVVPFCGAHLRQIDIQPAQRWMWAHLADADLSGLETDHAITLLRDGAPVASAGVLAKWPDVGYLWCVLGTGVAGPAFVPLTRLARRFMDGLPFPRIEAAVEEGFEPGYRWAALMGFERETGLLPARKFLGGRDFHLYAKVR